MLIRAADPTRPFTSGARVALDTRQRHYLTRVLRLSAGAGVELFDGRGARWAARLEGAAESAVLVIETALRATPESPLVIHLGQCLSSADKMDWTIEKAVELGATTITPLFQTAARSVSIRTAPGASSSTGAQLLRPPACRAGAICSQPWKNRARSHAGSRSRPPPPARARPAGAHHVIGLHAGQRARTLPICLLAGPESGLDDRELAAARSAGFQAVSLGPRVLRTETAGLAAIAALQAIAGDF